MCLGHGAKTIGTRGVLGWMERRFDFSTIERILDTPGGVAETIEVAHNWSGSRPRAGGTPVRQHPYVQRSLGSSAILLSSVKRALDPQGLLNPGKLGFA